MEDLTRNGGQPGYHDYANEQDDSEETASKNPRFPERIHYLLSEMEKEGNEHIASWQPHGRCFLVHDKKLFEKKVLPL
jgi:hypothetical protein